MCSEYDPPFMEELAKWCSNRVPGHEARLRRARVLFTEFADLLTGFPLIKVAGTSGKGTTCVLLESILATSGHVTGLYIKPHLISFCERIRVGNRPISNQELLRHTDTVFKRLRDFVERHGESFIPSLFESLLLIAASVFRDREVTIAVIEAGVGGANDATSLLPGELSLLTSVSLDHQIELGNSIEEIARDKAGIASPGTILVVGPNLPESARSVISSECHRRSIRFLEATTDAVEVQDRSIYCQRIRVSNGPEPYSLLFPFTGTHQLTNLATALTATNVLRQMGHINDEVALRGIENARLPGRFEFIEGSPSWLLDVAHNTAAIEVLIKSINELISDKEVVVILGGTEPHAYRSFVKLVYERGWRIGFCGGFTKAVPLDKLACEVPDSRQIVGLFRSPPELIDFFMHWSAASEAVIVITGSLFLVGQCRKEMALRGLPVKMVCL